MKKSIFKNNYKPYYRIKFNIKDQPITTTSLG